MNKVRERVLSNINPYLEFAEHKDLIAFTVGAEYFNYDYENDDYLKTDFKEATVVVEKDWLFDYMTKDGIEDPLDYLQNEYTWDDSEIWFLDAKEVGKVVAVSFN